MVNLVCALYFAVLLVLCAYGLHRAHLVYLILRHRPGRSSQRASESTSSDAGLPHVTIQLPTYNEATVVSRLLDAAASIDYPRDRFDIQVLDDSTDETQSIAQRKVRELRSRGVDIAYLRRPDRHGYKAGALDFGLERARGELVAIFDADFVPQPDFLRSVVGHFEDPRVGMVQTRWAHLNRDANLLTEIQAMMLDGHHLVENQARCAAGCFFNFSGTGGVWRRHAIGDAGGWQHDTLTEDLDLSYRAQLAGWKFVYRPDVVTPSELPEDISSLRAQQYRWAKGTIQTARKLLPTVMQAPLGIQQRMEAFFHMTPHAAYPLMVALTILMLPALLLMPATNIETMLLIDLPLCFGATGSLVAFYALAERAQGRSGWRAVRRMPALIGLGVGMAPYLSKAALEGMTAMAGEFVRTPKRGDNATRYRQRTHWPAAEILLGSVSVASVLASVQTHHWFALPFSALFAAGYFYVAIRVVGEQWQARRQAYVTAPVPVDVDSTEMVRAA